MKLLLIKNNKLPKRRDDEDARQYAYRILKKSIMELILPPNQKLNELELSNILSLSRTPVHDSITKLSRDRLVHLIPKKGAYVSGFDPELFEHSIWLQSTFGAKVIQNIFSKNLKPDETEVLKKKLLAFNTSIEEENYHEVTNHIFDYYKQLYLLSGNVDLIWNSLSKHFNDYRRILYFATSTNATVSQELYSDLNNLTNFIVTRQPEQAYLIFEQHLSKIVLLLEPIKKYKPDYIINSSKS